MWPLIRPGKDTVRVEPLRGAVRRGDIVLAQVGEAYVLHRVVGVGSGCCTLLGDNALVPERGVSLDSIVGRMTCVWRDERPVAWERGMWWALPRLWRCTRPVRRLAAWLRRATGAVRRVCRSRRGTCVPCGGREAACEPQDRQTLVVAYALMDAIACGLRGATASDLPGGCTWEDVWRLARANSVEAMSWFGVRDRGDLSPELRRTWERAAQLSLLRRTRFEVEREAIFAELDAAGVATMPLRGSLLAAYYPHPEMRTMADNDFLYAFVEDAPAGLRPAGATPRERAARRDAAMRAVERVMRGRGYEVKGVGSGVHDIYTKPPSFNFEPHRMLVAPDSPHAVFFDNPWARAERVEAGSLRFAMDATDEYLYLIAHAHKHARQAGTGLRIVPDVRVFWDARGSAVDADRLASALDELGLTAFERRLRTLADTLLAQPAPPQPMGERAVQERVPRRSQLRRQDENLLVYLVTSGAYGTHERMVDNALVRAAGRTPAGAGEALRIRARYLAARLLDRAAVESRFPRASRHAVLLPALQVARWVGGIWRDPAKLARELSLVHRFRGDDRGPDVLR